MKNRFKFFWLKTPLRRELQKPFLLKGNLPNKTDAFEIVLKLWDAPQRELHYFAQELFFKYKQQLEVSDISVIEIGRASCRERVEISGVAGSCKKKDEGAWCVSAR